VFAPPLPEPPVWLLAPPIPLTPPAPGLLLPFDEQPRRPSKTKDTAR